MNCRAAGHARRAAEIDGVVDHQDVMRPSTELLLLTSARSAGASGASQPFHRDIDDEKAEACGCRHERSRILRLRSRTNGRRDRDNGVNLDVSTLPEGRRLRAGGAQGPARAFLAGPGCARGQHIQ